MALISVNFKVLVCVWTLKVHVRFMWYCLSFTKNYIRYYSRFCGMVHMVLESQILPEGTKSAEFSFSHGLCSVAMLKSSSNKDPDYLFYLGYFDVMFVLYYC